MESGWRGRLWDGWTAERLIVIGLGKEEEGRGRPLGGGRPWSEQNWKKRPMMAA